MNEIMRGRFIVPAIADENDTPEQGQRKFRLALIENKQNGEKYIPAFTDHTEFMKMKLDGKPNALVMDFDGLANALLMPKSEGNGLAFNPFGNNIVIDKKNVVSLRMQKQQMKQNGADIQRQTVPPNTQISLGIPKEQPKPLIDAVCKYLATQPAITAAYLRLMKQNDDVSLLIIVDGIPSDFDAVFKGIFNAACTVVPREMKLSFIPAKSELGKKAIENLEPFYSKPVSEIMS